MDRCPDCRSMKNSKYTKCYKCNQMDMDKCPNCYDRKKPKKYKQCYLCATRPFCDQCENSGSMYAYDDTYIPCIDCHRGDGYHT